MTLTAPETAAREQAGSGPRAKALLLETAAAAAVGTEDSWIGPFTVTLRSPTAELAGVSTSLEESCAV